ncbi:tetratricopeptide repeat protein [Chitinophagaceae bacterium LB-8]|uniref:Tetratricopeptide repeat protein n=1 Tax=Paraflavisolibacter caeni TaxID=2982496 RepID=A0A9X2XZ93_9BACT|nr:tetratricopeptide repeat protein [Paraflavisolibacter caeni]MCU7551635.1 tetratricopeptide repeat protein [Paraflavisolibacter caeni]
MKRPQWITAGIALASVIILFFVSQGQIFGIKQEASTENHDGHNHAPGEEHATISIDTILFHAKENLSPEQNTRLNFLEKSISRGDVQDQKVHVYHQLANFWSDSARVFEPYAWYTAEAARLENSEKSLTFAAHLFLNNLRAEENPGLKNWKALQAKDLFERSLKVNPANDSSEIGLGAVYLYGGIGSPMEGIQKIRQVADKDPKNIFALMTLGQASIVSGQLDKAIDRFEKVLQVQPQNLEALISLADVYERKGDNTHAVENYRKSLPLIGLPEMKEAVEQRIAELSKK